MGSEIKHMRTTLNRLSKLYLYIYVYVYATVMINGKETINLRGNKRRNTEGVEAKKLYNYIFKNLNK